jgi:Fanconi Anaemia group E protein FANCE
MIDPWLAIATACSTSRAVELAALLPPSIPFALPCAIEELPPRARSNLAAVSRALYWTLPGVPPPPVPSARVVSDQQTAQLSDNKHAPLLDPRPVREAQNRATVDKSLGAAVVDQVQAQTPVARPTRAELAHSSTLVHWAQHSPHTATPPAALTAVLSTSEPAALLRATISAELPAEATAALITAIVTGCGARVASALTETVVLIRVAALSAPAPRDLMKSIVALAEAHWRAVMPLYSLLGNERVDTPVTGPTAEVLVRIAAVLDPQGAKEALLLCCSGMWREEGVRVIEALLAKCKSEPGVAAAVVAGLEQNVQGMEKSLRFGKLLHVCCKDIPDVSTTHADVMRSIASKSTVFLAKRAIALLPTPNT